MGKIISSYIFPHPPLLVPEVGNGAEQEVKATLKAAGIVSSEIREAGPSTIIVTTPHAPAFEDYVYISDKEVIKGNMGRFGRADVSLTFNNNTKLVEKIVKYAAKAGIRCGGINTGIADEYNRINELDHGAFVPLYHINKEYGNFKVVHISSISTLSLEEFYRFGMCIRNAVEESEEKVVIVASGDMSHRLTKDAPYGYSTRGKEFDNLVINSIKQNNIERLLEVDSDLCESAGECGLSSFIIMLGVMDSYDIMPDVYSYEGPFGVGYAIVKFQIGQVNPLRRILEKRTRNKNEKEDPYVALARKALETYVKEQKVLEVPDGLPVKMLNKKAGTFVSIKTDGQLRGCIGTMAPVRENIANEIINNAISSGTQDPRFYPVTPDELDRLVYSVDVLTEPEPISSIEELDPFRYGVVVRSGYRTGVLLPNLDGIETPEEQVEIALEKAGIRKSDKYSMERFEVVRHK